MGDMGGEGWTETVYADGSVQILTHPEKRAQIFYVEDGDEDENDIGIAFRALWDAVHENCCPRLQMYVNNMGDNWRLFWTHFSPKISSFSLSLKDASNDAFFEMCNYISRSEINHFSINMGWIQNQRLVDKMTCALLECKNLRTISISDMSPNIDVSRIFCGSSVNSTLKKIFMHDGSQAPSAWNNIFRHIQSGVEYRGLWFSRMDMPDEIAMDLCKVVKTGRVFSTYISFRRGQNTAIAPVIDILKHGQFLRCISINMHAENKETAEKIARDIEPGVMDMQNRKNPVSMRVDLYYPMLFHSPGRAPLRGAKPGRISIRNKFHGVISPSKI